LSEYDGDAGREVRLSCRHTYRVYEKENKLLVATFSVSEATGVACVLPNMEEFSPTEYPIHYWDAAEALTR
jgi:hypothetical protein